MAGLWVPPWAWGAAMGGLGGRPSHMAMIDRSPGILRDTRGATTGGQSGALTTTGSAGWPGACSESHKTVSRLPISPAALRALRGRPVTPLAAYIGEDVIIRYDPRDMAELRVYFGDAFVCRAINPELAGETIGLKDIIRARNRRRREVRTTLVERETTIEALLSLRRGEELQSEPPFPEPVPAGSTLPARSRLKSYFNE
jgi:hypothetical protein